ncbi:hypothetical protein [Marimonas arenosa]|uniref:Uncharacterized protein n=1 Tax=Marimonas arenosa TaxID=1795305 RepID=A0AAE4B4P9_9RHOB|nr:hypothetical protein [Marimonas arenosa]MDQ2090337.1 hypothetical protein [Marimonas arenosa]
MQTLQRFSALCIAMAMARFGFDGSAEASDCDGLIQSMRDRLAKGRAFLVQIPKAGERGGFTNYLATRQKAEPA